ncbi:hypothetical protein ACFSF7_00060 [Ligilactobacillus acidipiscis]|uniref:hypothetical protein n=1 Tax=Ligilactobacillus acidipiscis TaxID=89059 RepID=UPI00363A79A7
MYLAQLNVTAQDVYLKQKTSDEAEPFGINGTAKNAARQKILCLPNPVVQAELQKMQLDKKSLNPLIQTELQKMQ